jgi:micrococcal nuclease
MTHALLRLIAAFILSQTAGAAIVERVIDGDTIVILQDGRKETVRYIGIDAPESVHPRRGMEPFGKAASDFNRSLVGGREVRLEFDVEPRDHYGRLLAYVYLDSLFVNAELVLAGYAQLMTIPPNVRHVDLFRRLQREARENNCGLWAESGISERTPGANSPGIYITRTGRKYHTDGCRFLRSSRIRSTLEEAVRLGLEPCSVCKPPRGKGLVRKVRP